MSDAATVREALGRIIRKAEGCPIPQDACECPSSFECALNATMAALTALEQDRHEAKRALETALIGSSMLVNSAKEQGIEWRADGPGATMVCHNTRAEQAEAALARVRQEERERCALEVSTHHVPDCDGEQPRRCLACRVIAAIRALPPTGGAP